MVKDCLVFLHTVGMPYGAGIVAQFSSNSSSEWGAFPKDYLESARLRDELNKEKKENMRLRELKRVPGALTTARTSGSQGFELYPSDINPHNITFST